MKTVNGHTAMHASGVGLKQKKKEGKKRWSDVQKGKEGKNEGNKEKKEGRKKRRKEREKEREKEKGRKKGRNLKNKLMLCSRRRNVSFKQQGMCGFLKACMVNGLCCSTWSSD